MNFEFSIAMASIPLTCIRRLGQHFFAVVLAAEAGPGILSYLPLFAFLDVPSYLVHKSFKSKVLGRETADSICVYPLPELMFFHR